MPHFCKVGSLFEDSEKLNRRDLCFASSLKLALFGFVFLEPEDDFIFIIPCSKGGCINFMHKQIGSVCKKKGRFVEDSLQS